jgi:hypothetical protein
MRQETRAFENGFGGLSEVGNRRGVPKPGKFAPRLRVAQLRFVAKREQSLFAAERGAGFGDGNNPIERKIRAFVSARRMGERAVMADVATKLRQRNEDFLRERHQLTVRKITPRGSRLHELVKITVCERVYLGRSKPIAIRRTLKKKGGRPHCAATDNNPER